MREMKDSGIEWVGQIPENWNVMANKYVMHKTKVIIPTYCGEDILSLTINGVIVRDLDAGGKMPASFDGYQRLQTGNLLMCLFDYDVTPRCIGLIKDNGITSPAYSQFIVDKGNHTDYYYYYYLMIDHSKALLHMAKNLRHSFTEEQLGMIHTPVPPVEEQQRIASFLDTKCAEIDALTADIQKEIETLQEYRKSVITEAVTKGLDPNVEMKDSGVEWIGEIPKHWGICKIKYNLHRAESRNPGNVQVLSLYRDYGVIPKDSRDDNHNITSEDTTKYKYVQVGNFVINKMKAWQGSVAVSEHEGIVSPAYYVYQFDNDNLNKRYFHYLIRSCYKDEFRRLSGGIREGQWDLPSEALDNTFIVIPSEKEQTLIINFLDTKCSEIDSIIVDKQNQLETLAEYRKSLIYEYVTGKKEVPTA
ncbi:MAG: restriction endonuclease subunit S [Spirochaetales bacterium]|nr:restriction endonuclease subunit S [Spirochaetales bacterium]